MPALRPASGAGGAGPAAICGPDDLALGDVVIPAGGSLRDHVAVNPDLAGDAAAVVLQLGGDRVVGRIAERDGLLHRVAAGQLASRRAVGDVGHAAANVVGHGVAAGG